MPQISLSLISEFCVDKYFLFQKNMCLDCKISNSSQFLDNCKQIFLFFSNNTILHRDLRLIRA